MWYYGFFLIKCSSSVINNTKQSWNWHFLCYCQLTDILASTGLLFWCELLFWWIWWLRWIERILLIKQRQFYYSYYIRSIIIYNLAFSFPILVFYHLMLNSFVVHHHTCTILMFFNFFLCISAGANQNFPKKIDKLFL